jgi:hypothetical protein
MKFLPSIFLFFAVAVIGSAKNMNGEPGQYKIANGDESQNSQFQTDYTAEYFEVYSGTIQTRYSEVFWTGMPLVPLPDDIVERFSNKTMAVVGYEVDQVKVDKEGNEVPVPITHAYNHHYCGPNQGFPRDSSLWNHSRQSIPLGHGTLVQRGRKEHRTTGPILFRGKWR